MEQLYQDYKDVAEFFIVYISEAHASDGSWPVAYAKELGIKEHTSFGERCTVADRLVKDKKLTIPCLVDKMDNTAADAYQARPDRVYLVRTDGRLGVAAARGPWGLKPGLDAAKKWLAAYRKTGEDPPPKQASSRKAEPEKTEPKKVDEKPKPQYRGLLGPTNEKVKHADGKTLLWAGGDARGDKAEWFDITNAPIPSEKLQFGIGKDRIRSIDDPLFVSPDDARLLELPPSHYRREERPKTNDEIMVIGYGVGGEARAYPTALLDQHELVNDRVGGKPVTVGW
jgi:hypothetical protein